MQQECNNAPRFGQPTEDRPTTFLQKVEQVLRDDL